ncbi:DUF6161 domain-containing protein [Roseibium sp. SCP14]|uniref:DUF6161 domain-containing protein n=1 Tax=Roseibium sp. SCP14 TaxID=3141375 RepID=UPI00333DD917
MIVEHAVFWRDFFLRIRNDNTRHEPLSSEGQNIGATAATLLIREFFGEVPAKELQALFGQKRFPGFEKISVYPKDLASRAKQEFAASNLESNWFDLAAIVFETMGITDFPRDINLSSQTIEFSSELIKYGSYYPVIRLNLDAASLQYEPDLAAGAERFFSKLDAMAVQQNASLTKNLTGHVEAQKSIALDEIDSRMKGALDRLETAGTDMLENKKNELVETIINEDAMQLWESKAEQHTKYFRIGAGVFTGAVLVPVFCVLWNWGSITSAIKTLTPNGQSFALGNLVAVTVPVLGYAWVLRLISRFTLQNMALADDAMQRSVMARTFIRLVGQGQVDEKHDRTIMLSALFRPLPGSSEPDIQPPNLTDFLKAKP